ncbi:oxysterol-binding protein-related protein 1C-like [Triticum dicoccoides]|uniref:oxysterol-binding protein-related protein 1C-like n=1 Tax=Triticum dicoccoides TaxID=85692 RepID=UPI001890F719|nr:oxysterol-binding protein-related protein 1C-like [Triticum dicoccoides]
MGMRRLCIAARSGSDGSVHAVAAAASATLLALLEKEEAPSPVTKTSTWASIALAAPQEEAGHGDTGSGISGVLYKWVNYGRGWRPRWFALSDGVLSYYKIHGPDRIDLSRDTDRGAKVIGEDSLRRLARPSSASAPHSNGHGHHQTPRKPLGEIHLKVSTVRESRSDDRRFSIFSGTKRLHLQAETREDRAAWLEALRATKEMFPRMSTSEMVGLGDTAAAAAVSTERLKKRLQQERVSDAAIADSERIVREEFEALHKQLVLLKQKQALLLDTLRHLETEKVDLENTLVDESQRQSKEYGSASRPRNEKLSGMTNLVSVNLTATHAIDIRAF